MGKAGHQTLPGTDATGHATGVIRQKAFGPHLIAVRSSAHAGHCHPIADFHPFDRVDTHQRVGDLGVEAVVDRLAESRGHTFGLDLKTGPRRIPFTA